MSINFPDQSQDWMTSWAEWLLKSLTPNTHLNYPQLCTQIYQLLEAMQEGDSCVEVTTDIRELSHLVVDHEQALHQIAPFVHQDQQLYLYRYWSLEYRLAQQIARLATNPIAKIDVSEFKHLLIDERQQQALQMVASQALSMITGGPGTGKTYTLARIIAALYESNPNLRIAMAAPTGKAAQRMEEAIVASFQDEALSQFKIREHQPKPITLHRLLGLGTRHIPQFHHDQPLPYDLIVVDEASMLDLQMAHMLFDAVADQTRLILLGDAQQLASVDVGCVLADLQASPYLASYRVHLTTSRRFKEGAHIKKMADFIQRDFDSKEQIIPLFEQIVAQPNALQPIQTSSEQDDLIQVQYLDEGDSMAHYEQLMLGYESYIDALKHYLTAPDPDQYIAQVIRAFDDYRVLTAVRHGALGLRQLNRQIEQWILQALSHYTAQQGDWYVGRPVMMTYNDYQIGLSNGDIGICFKRSSSEGSRFEVYFPSSNTWIAATRLPKNIETAFALTIHKSQGSEFTHTAVVLDQHAINLLSKELLYTAITRAKKVVSLMTDQEALAQACYMRTTRKSGLLNKINTQLELCSFN